MYLYELLEVEPAKDAEYIGPLIDGKYIEWMYMRFTIYSEKLDNCTLDFQRHTGDWMVMYSGSLEDCLNHLEQNSNCF